LKFSVPVEHFSQICEAESTAKYGASPQLLIGKRIVGLGMIALYRCCAASVKCRANAGTGLAERDAAEASGRSGRQGSPVTNQGKETT